MTINLKTGNVEKATEYKQGLEQRQRDEAKERKEKGLKVETKVVELSKLLSVLPLILRKEKKIYFIFQGIELMLKFFNQKVLPQTDVSNYYIFFCE